MIEIKKINTFDTIIVRHPVLRLGKPVSTCHFEGDDLPTTSHFGLNLDNRLIAVISAFEVKNKYFTEENQYQIRGMAVLEEFQNRGFGEQLLQYCENEIRIKKGELIWFNARQTALGFYKKSGYAIIGDQFEIPDVGTHYVLYKKI
jgi:ribosomal protein S18 acetylase RimI-like enzyme